MATSQSEGTTDAMVQKQRPVMPADLFSAAIAGNSNFFVQRLGVAVKERSLLLEVKIKASSTSAIQEPVEDVAAEYKLDITTQFGDTILHLLLLKGHNELALNVFESGKYLLKAGNKNLETPLHIAAKVGNEEVIRNLIQLDSVAVKEALRVVNYRGDTALHIAAMHNHGGICHALMKLDRQMACLTNQEGLSAFYIATIEGYMSVVQSMLEVDPSLVYTQFPDGMFPILVTTKTGNKELVKYFITNYPNYVDFVDSRGRNFCHMAAELENEEMISMLSNLWTRRGQSDVVREMMNATDYEGNTPLHIAAITGHRLTLKKVWQMMEATQNGKENLRNKKGKTAFDLSVIQVKNSSTAKDIEQKVAKYMSRKEEFTPEWFKITKESESPYEYKWERAQLIGLGSVLITTVAFAAAFAIPGGYNPDHGYPVLGKKYMFKAFILANALSFLQAFTSLFTLVSSAIVDPEAVDIQYAAYKFIAAAGCMVLAFGLGSYVMLAAVSLPLAIVVLVFALQLGSPFMYKTISIHRAIFEIFIGCSGFDICTTPRAPLPQKIVFQIMITCFLGIFLCALA